MRVYTHLSSNLKDSCNFFFSFLFLFLSLSLSLSLFFNPSLSSCLGWDCACVLALNVLCGIECSREGRSRPGRRETNQEWRKLTRGRWEQAETTDEGKFKKYARQPENVVMTMTFAHWTSRDSSVGRASDWRSEGPRFDPGSRQVLICLLFAYDITHGKGASNSLELEAADEVRANVNVHSRIRSPRIVQLLWGWRSCEKSLASGIEFVEEKRRNEKEYFLNFRFLTWMPLGGGNEKKPENCASSGEESPVALP